MGTRSVIARRDNLDPSAWLGRYHHWDGYPTGLGKALYTLHKEHFSDDTEGMLKFLIHDHPAGWSSIVEADYNIAPGGLDIGAPGFDFEAPHGPVCYCHGIRKQKNDPMKAAEITSEDFVIGKTASAEWLYVIDSSSRNMEVFKVPSTWQEDVQPVWSVAKIDLGGPSPAWGRIESRGYGVNSGYTLDPVRLSG